MFILLLCVMCLFVAIAFVLLLFYEKRRYVDSALASAARLFMRGSVYIFRQADAQGFAYRSVGVFAGPGTARLGCRTHPKKRATRHLRSLRFHTQPTLPRQLSARAWLHDRFRSTPP